MSKEDFKNYVESVQAQENYKAPLAFAIGVRRSVKGKTLDVFFPLINYNTSFGTAAVLIDVLGAAPENGCSTINQEQLQQVWQKFSAYHGEETEHPNVAVLKSLIDGGNSVSNYSISDIIAYFMYDKDSAVESAEEAYFKLNCLSQRYVEPHGLCLDGAFGKLTNVAWSNQGPILPEDFEAEKLKSLMAGKELSVSHIDKFPYLVNCHIPTGVRIASGSQVRLGAYLGEGTTVMPAGYINFNAGTEGNTMVEGRISAGVFVKKDSDIGGGASIMGTLSGGNNHVISIDEKCLLGANAGTGISLGFGCTIAAGLYVYGGMKVSLYNLANEPVDTSGNAVSEGENVVKAAELSGRDHLLFIQDSVSGKVICKPNNKTIELNSQLHNN